MTKKIHQFNILLIVISLSFFACQKKTPVEQKLIDEGTLTFISSDDNLNAVFNWAKKQALAYAFEGDPVGPWYEAALGGREAFCMRDVSHQANGAHFLGLAPHTKNMLEHFAKNISDSKDWCSYWEINLYGEPAYVDYFSEDEFWYNLPANFDILDCCYRMYMLTGDQSYFKDPVFLNFYEKTVYDYVERWSLGIGEIMDRDRIMNVKGSLGDRRFKLARGIPGYDEADPGFIVGLDLLATEHAGFVAYARFQELLGNNAEAAKFITQADELEDFINAKWWDSQSQQYFNYLDQNRQLRTNEKSSSPFPLLYWGPMKDASKARPALRNLLENLPDIMTGSIELQSHLPEILYKCDEPDSAYQQLLNVSKNARKDYPEASFATIGAMVTGLMGIELEPHSPAESLTWGGYVDRIITTKSGLTDQTKWAEMKDVSIRSNDISVRHEGTTKTILTNNSGPSVLWKPYFMGSYDSLKVNGKYVKAWTNDLLAKEDKVTWVLIYSVSPGQTISVEAPSDLFKVKPHL